MNNLRKLKYAATILGSIAAVATLVSVTSFWFHSAPSEGTVYDTAHVTEHQETKIVCGQKVKGACIESHPVTVTVPESWSLEVGNGIRRGWTNVPEDLYDTTTVGNHVSLRG